MSEHYRILNLRSENVKRIKAVDITPDPSQNVIVVTGRNGQGKTSVLDSIFWALAGKKHIQDMPIRDGEERAKVELDLGEYKVIRTFTHKDSYISIENKDGFKTTSPQDMLDKLMGVISFDPLEFTRQPSDKQYATLRALVPLDVDIDAIDAAIKEDYDERTLVNRQVKELAAQLVDMTVPPEGLPDEPVIVAELVNKRDVLTQQIAAAEAVDREIETYGNTLQDIIQQIAALNTRLEKGQKALEEKSAQRKAMTVPDDAEVNGLTEEIQQAEVTNRAIQNKLAYAAKDKEHTDKMLKSKDLTKAIDEREQEKLDALARAKMPIKGLAFNAGAVFFNGVPFTQASNAEQIKVSTAIAMAMNPKIRVIRIKDGSLLDDESMATLRDMAAEHDFQVWVERVADGDPMAVVIEDGEVAHG